MHQGPPDKPTEREPKILSFEEFVNHDLDDQTPHYRNFYLHFTSWDELAIAEYEERDYFRKFLSEHENLYRFISEKIKRLDRSSKQSGEALKEVEKDLYQAYVIMRNYGASDDELFI